MSVLFNKPKNLKYTDLCIYIDKNMSKIKDTGAYPDVENKIYEYLYLTVYALSCVNGYFKNFNDYDQFSSYSASELYMAMRNKLLNEGKEVRGKVIAPVKSSLNFIKATLFPLKVNYQRDTFATIIDPKIHGGTDLIESNIKDNIQSQYRPELFDAYSESVKTIPSLIWKVLKQTPFRNDKYVLRKLYLSIELTLLNDITIPNKLHSKLLEKETKDNDNKITANFINAYKINQEDPLLWHLDDNMKNYVRLLTIKVKKEFSKSLNFYIHSDDLSEELLDSIVYSAYDNYNETGDNN